MGPKADKGKLKVEKDHLPVQSLTLRCCRKRRQAEHMGNGTFNSEIACRQLFVVVVSKPNFNCCGFTG